MYREHIYSQCPQSVVCTSHLVVQLKPNLTQVFRALETHLTELLHDRPKIKRNLTARNSRPLHAPVVVPQCEEHNVPECGSGGDQDLSECLTYQTFDIYSIQEKIAGKAVDRHLHPFDP